MAGHTDRGLSHICSQTETKPALRKSPQSVSVFKCGVLLCLSSSVGIFSVGLQVRGSSLSFIIVGADVCLSAIQITGHTLTKLAMSTIKDGKRMPSYSLPYTDRVSRCQQLNMVQGHSKLDQPRPLSLSLYCVRTSPRRFQHF